MRDKGEKVVCWGMNWVEWNSGVADTSRKPGVKTKGDDLCRSKN